ncbi:replication initiation factor family protein [Metabacillus dongyingensis]|uniref:replication initiation factor family protein n=1 Tax=Metabacillus dongyingensis TaxID=2874282 RepID=UPI001CBE615D|nr:replication initiation factor family protein [Metabacillus dongyingensis]UAL52284.1 replication initiation factor family protein [Metabacillus dongyingensis]
MLANVKLDKLVLEYVSIPLNFFHELEEEGEISNIRSNEGFHYHRCLQISKKGGAYIKFYYQSKYEIWKPFGKLRLETHPKHLSEFSTLLNRLKEICSDIYFVSTDVAFDIPLPLNNIFVTSNTGRQMNIFQGTRYFGGKGQRGKHGYCRIYDKREELARRGIVIDDELTRVEIVYKPTKPIKLEELLIEPPSLNNLYTGTIINLDKQVTPINKAILICLLSGKMAINEFSRHYRRVLKKHLDSQEQLDFDQMLQSAWIEQISIIKGFLL